MMMNIQQTKSYQPAQPSKLGGPRPPPALLGTQNDTEDSVVRRKRKRGTEAPLLPKLLNDNQRNVLYDAVCGQEKAMRSMSINPGARAEAHRFASRFGISLFFEQGSHEVQAIQSPRYSDQRAYIKAKNCLIDTLDLAVMKHHESAWLQRLKIRNISPAWIGRYMIASSRQSRQEMEHIVAEGGPEVRRAAMMLQFLHMGRNKAIETMFTPRLAFVLHASARKFGMELMRTDNAHPWSLVASKLLYASDKFLPILMNQQKQTMLAFNLDSTLDFDTILVR